MQDVCRVRLVGGCKDDVGSLEWVVYAYMQPVQAPQVRGRGRLGWPRHSTRGHADVLDGYCPMTQQGGCSRRPTTLKAGRRGRRRRITLGQVVRAGEWWCAGTAGRIRGDGV